MSVIGWCQILKVMLNEDQSQFMPHGHAEIVREEKPAISRDSWFAERRMYQTNSGLRDHMRDSVRA